MTCGLAVCGHVGVATQASGVLFITRRGTCVRARAGSSQSNVISWRRRTCLNLSVARVLFSRLADGYSRWVSDLLSFESETYRVSGIWETRGWHEWRMSCGNERIIGAAVRSVRAVESLYVTALGSAAYIGALVPCQGVVWVQKRSDASQKTSVKTGIMWLWILKVGRAQRR